MKIGLGASPSSTSLIRTIQKSKKQGGGAATGLVATGLILNLDSTDTNSYPGTGTVWTDLSGKGHHFDLVNGPTFSTDDGGTIVTDGANDYIKSQGNIDEENAGNSTFAYVKVTDLTSTTYSGNYYTWVITKGFNNASQNNINMLFRATTSQWSTYNYASLSLTLRNSSFSDVGTWNGWDESTVPQIAEDNWYYVGYSTNGGSGDTVNMYVNGVNVGSFTLSGERTPTTNQPMVVASDSWSRNFGMPGSNKNYHMYNRELTAAEVLQNYNAIKVS
jgi:hypothetical protein